MCSELMAIERTVVAAAWGLGLSSVLHFEDVVDYLKRVLRRDVSLSNIPLKVIVEAGHQSLCVPDRPMIDLG